MRPISSAKNERKDAAAYARSVGSYFEEIVSRVFDHYEAALARNGAVDFDDRYRLEGTDLYAQLADGLGLGPPRAPRSPPPGQPPPARRAAPSS